uniref:AlNc14C661G12352 protein n=1 Tax=Albugo laibachii Nc14 TaxID=890382 RepID=F0X1N8_9STRA|nr:AlNc14C661G12352 [Albugo laibachii Nc14]|eukprot:CCA27736.1 AlNc14C661G12352 [Albugo laibachii Nc14]
MGSYIAIVNDTSYEWRCKVALDDKSMKISSLIFSLIVSVAGIFITLAAFAPHLFNIKAVTAASATASAGAAAGTSMIAGMNINGLLSDLQLIEIGGNALTTKTSIAGYTIGLVRTVQEVLGKNDFITIPSNQTHQWEKMAPFAWRQCLCVRAYTSNTTIVRIESVLMRPIFGGRPGKRVRSYTIQNWIKKHGEPQIEDVNAVLQIEKIHRKNDTRLYESLVVPTNGTRNGSSANESDDVYVRVTTSKVPASVVHVEPQVLHQAEANLTRSNQGLGNMQ